MQLCLPYCQLKKGVHSGRIILWIATARSSPRLESVARFLETSFNVNQGRVWRKFHCVFNTRRVGAREEITEPASRKKPTPSLRHRLECPVEARTISFDGATMVRVDVRHSHKLSQELLELRMDPELRQILEEEARRNRYITTALLRSRAQEWVHEHFGAVDSLITTRQLHPSDDALSSIMTRMKSQRRLAKCDLQSLKSLQTTWLRQKPQDLFELHQTDSGFCVIYQSSFQHKMLLTFGSLVFGIDSTHRISLYNLSLFFLMVSTPLSHGQCCGMFIVEHETKDQIQFCLERLCPQGFAPKFAMLDKSAAEMAALRSAFPSIKLLLCQFHLHQAWIRALRASEYQIPTKQHQNIVYMLLLRLEKAATESEFQQAAKEFKSRIRHISTRFEQYFENEWLHDTRMWAFYHRTQFHGGYNTNNFNESFNSAVKADLGSRYHRLRLDDVVTQLLQATFPMLNHKFANLHQRAVRDNLSKPSEFGNFGPAFRAMLEVSKARGSSMDASAVSIKSPSVSDQFQVKSSRENISYDVDLSIGACNCPFFLFHNVACKHIFAVLHHYGLIDKR